MELVIKAYSFCLNFIYPFGIAHGTRNSTDTLYVTASFNGHTGYGEAALPPYLGYNVNDLVLGFDKWIPHPLEGISAITDIFSLLKKSDNTLPVPIKTATDIALLDLYGKLAGKPTRDLLGIPPGNSTLCSYTLGISDLDVFIEKIKKATEFKLFKIKLGGDNDRERVETYLQNSSMPFCVDANQAWKSVKDAKTQIDWLKERGCLFVEQPLSVNMISEMNELFLKTSLPIILDESIQSIKDLEN